MTVSFGYLWWQFILLAIGSYFMGNINFAIIISKLKKRDMRSLWITRINAACRVNSISYSQFINGLNKANIELNRKVLADLAVTDKAAFASLVESAKKALAK